VITLSLSYSAPRAAHPPLRAPRITSIGLVVAAAMSSSLLRPPSHLSPATALHLAQQAPQIIKSSPGSISTSVLQSLLSASETPELWTIYENLLLSCLRTGDDESAHMCLGRLINRFGDDNERIMALIGLMKEADAEDNATLQAILKEYETILQKSPTNIVRRTGQCSRVVPNVNALSSLSSSAALLS
jgi:hypothetical protein